MRILLAPSVPDLSDCGMHRDISEWTKTASIGTCARDSLTFPSARKELPSTGLNSTPGRRTISGATGVPRQKGVGHGTKQ
jgi:hypothetical protein